MKFSILYTYLQLSLPRCRRTLGSDSGLVGSDIDKYSSKK